MKLSNRSWAVNCYMNIVQSFIRNDLARVTTIGRIILSRTTSEQPYYLLYRKINIWEFKEQHTYVFFFLRKSTILSVKRHIFDFLALLPMLPSFGMFEFCPM